MALFALILIALIIGSFLNVVIYRLPLMWQKPKAGFNLAYPFSHCPNCQTPLRFWHNIPVISFICLKGRCAFCHAPISYRYPIVELLTLLCTLIVWLKWGWHMELVPLLLLTYALIALTFIDIDEHILPDIITLPLLFCGLAVNSFNLFTSASSAIWGAIVGFSALWLFDRLYLLLRKRHGIGMGDSKLLAGLAAWFGIEALLPIILTASLLGVITAGVLMFMRKLHYDTPIAFGPFLTIGGFGYLYAGSWFNGWYW